MIDFIALAISSGLAHVATNLDNLIVMVGLFLTIGRIPVLTGYLLAQCIVLAAAFGVAEGVDTELPLPVGYLGLIPLGLGVLTLWKQRYAVDAETPGPSVKPNAWAITVLFLSLSFDTFAVFAPLLADSQAIYNVPVLLGAGLSAMTLAFAGLAMSRVAPGGVARVETLERFAPYVMVAIGLYVVLNTATDAV